MQEDNIFTSEEFEVLIEAIKDLAIFMGILYILSAVFNYIQSYSLTTVSNRFANKNRRWNYK